MSNCLINMRIVLPVKWQNYHSGKGFFQKEMGTKSQGILSKWQNVKLLDSYENYVTSQMAKISLWKWLFSQRNGDKKPSYSKQMAKC